MDYRNVSRLAILVFAVTAPASASVPYLVKDVRPESAQIDARIGFPNEVVGEVFFFGTSEPAPGLWRTDGSTTGTYRVFNDAPGFHLPMFQPILNVEGVLYYPVDTTDGSFLYRTDGTTPGTQLAGQVPLTILDLAPCANGKVCFATLDNYVGVSDGTPGGTGVLLSTAPNFGEPHQRREMTSLNGRVFFNAVDYAAGQCVKVRVGLANEWVCGELWTTDGTPAGTHLVKDLFPGAIPSAPHDLAASNDKLFFSALNPVWGTDCRVWVSDGSPEGTRILLPNHPIECVVGGVRVEEYRGFTYLRSPTFDVLRSDGTPEGTVRLVDFLKWPASVQIQQLFRAGDDLLMLVASATAPTLEIWSFDGEAAFRIGDAPPIGTMLGYLPSKRRFYHVIGSGTGSPRELWSFDGKGHEKVWQFPERSTASVSTWATTPKFLAFQVVGAGGWITDGTAEGTQRLDLASVRGADSSPSEFFASSSHVFFRAADSTDTHLYASDGTSSGTVPLPGLDGPLNMLSIDGRLYFRDQGYLWITDGTPAGTRSVTSWFGASKRIYEPPAFIGETAIFQTGDALARRDPTGAITMLGLTGQMTGFRPLQNEVLFWTWDPSNRASVRATDGTPQGTRVLLSHVDNGGRDAQFLPDGGRAFFGAKPDGATGEWLWVTDGTAEGTKRIKQLTSNGSEIFVPALVWRGIAFFTVKDPSLPFGLVWRSDGTSEGTYPLSTTRFRYVAASAGALTLVRAEFDKNFEIWTSDGTASGTMRRHAGRAASITPPFPLAAGGMGVAIVPEGPWHQLKHIEVYDIENGRSTFHSLGSLRLDGGVFHANGRLFFRAFRLSTGYELWAIPLGDEPVVEPAEISIQYKGLARVEGGRAAVFRVTINTTASATPAVVASTIEGTLREGRDYTPFTRVIRFENDNDVTLVVPLRADASGAFSIALTAPMNARIVQGFATAIVSGGSPKRRAARH